MNCTPALRPLVSRYDLLNPRVFSSVLTKPDTEESDLDLLVDRGPSTTLFTLAGINSDAEELTGVRVSVLPRIFPSEFRDKVLQQAQPL